MTMARKSNIRIINNVNDFKVYHQFREELVRKEFRFSTVLKNGAERFLHSIKKLWLTRSLLQMMDRKEDMLAHDGHKSSLKYPSETKLMFVSVHIRRGDYAEWILNNLKGYLVSKLFFEEAMNWFRKKVSFDLRISRQSHRLNNKYIFPNHRILW